MLSCGQLDASRPSADSQSAVASPPAVPMARSAPAGPAAARSSRPRAAAAAAARRSSQQPPGIRSGINFVSVDVIVTDRKGKPVLDLKQEEFELHEDRKPQTIETFEIVKIDDDARRSTGRRRSEIRSLYDEEREAARPNVRLFVMLLDDYHVRRGNDMSVRKPLIDFVQNQLGAARTWSRSCIR